MVDCEKQPADDHESKVQDQSSEAVPHKYLSQAITLERKSDFRRTIGFVFLFFILETLKQISNFGLSRANGGVYPIPLTLLLTLTENLKLILIMIKAKCSNLQTDSWKPSWKFGLPAIFYLVTNILYLGALTEISPPVWMVLIQTRTLYTAAAYKIIFRREVTLLQGMGCILVVCSIATLRLPALHDGQGYVTPFTLCMSQIAALLSTAASICIELLLKNDTRSFCEQQFWLYLWGSAMATIYMMCVEDAEKFSKQLKELMTSNPKMLQLVIVTVSSTALAGLCIPVVVKNLDTIVKDYLTATNNIILAIVTAVLFPDDFSLSWIYVLSLVILVVGISMYEKKTL